LTKLLKEGKKHVPVDLACYIAREVACALLEMHRKLVIHRDIKSENVLVDLDSKSHGTPVVKLSDFDRSIPLHSQSHTCCIAHLGTYPPNVCVGTPCWMAPEVLQAMHEKTQYGLVSIGLNIALSFFFSTHFE
jgi:serine/threonine protein kinase